MSGRGRSGTAVSDGRKGAFATRHILAGLIVLVCVACIPSIASADVDQTGALEKVSSPITSKVGEAKPLNSSANGDYKCIDPYSVIGSKPYYFTIGNCPSGWVLEVVSYASENTVTHEHSYGGYIGDAYSYCGWIDTRYVLEKVNSNKNSACASGSGSSMELEDSEFMEKYDENQPVHDGTYVVNPLPCPEYANYRPWSTNNVEKELIRTAPAYAALTPGSETPALKWRYTTKYSSTDGTGQYVMVRDARVGGTEGNWVFVPRSCLSSTLPPNEGEAHDPLPPAVTTGTPTGIGTTSANLVGFVNPHGIDTKYFFEYGTTESYGSYTTTEDAGSGSGVVQEEAAIGGLAPYTTYYFRIVASSATGESFGGAVAFTTQAVPPTATTAAATGVQFRRATLNGTVNPNGAPTEYFYQYGTTSSYGLETSKANAGSGSSAVEVPVVVTGIEPNTLYHYRLVALNPGGPSYGSDQTVTTAAPPAVSISNRLQSSVTLSWTSSENAASYTIKRNGGTVGSTSGLTYVDAELHSTTFYTWEVVANDANESAGSNTVTRATTPVNTVEADVTGNGKTDLVYIYPGGYIDTFLSKGNGTYEEVTEHLKEFESTPGLWLSGDFNGDGKTDLAYIYPGGYIDTFLSKGNGTYEEKSELIEKGFNTTDGTWEVGDFNGDGKTDLAYILPEGYIDTFLSKGNGTYEEIIEHVKEFDSTSGKWFTGDFGGGKTDLAYIYPGGYIDTFLSKGNGTYEEKSELIEKGFNSSSGQWFTGDVTGEAGKTDLVYIYPGSTSYIEAFLSNSNGTYERKVTELKEFDSSSGQWLLDGTDLFYIYPEGYIDTFVSKGGTYEEKSEHLKEFDSSAGRWRTGEIADNGKADLVYTYSGGDIDTFLSNGNGTYEEVGEYLKEFDDTTGLWL